MEHIDKLGQSFDMVPLKVIVWCPTIVSPFDIWAGHPDSDICVCVCMSLGNTHMNPVSIVMWLCLCYNVKMSLLFNQYLISSVSVQL